MKLSPKVTTGESRNWAQIFGTVVKGWNKYFIALLKFSRAFGPRKYQQGNNYTYRVIVDESHDNNELKLNSVFDILYLTQMIGRINREIF